MHTSSPEAVGMSSERLNRITPIMQSYIDNELLAGISTLAYRNGQIVHSNNLGYRHLATKAPITDNTIYRMYTMTKPLTTIAMMQLYEQGKFQPTDPVSKFISAFGKTKVNNGMTSSGMAQNNHHQ
jgi:CubicO group peptidase (beta-lactamase class C family)